MRMRILGALAVLLFAWPATARASVQYTFTDSSTLTGYSLTFDEPSLLTGSGSTTITSFTSLSLTGTFWSSSPCGPISTFAFQFSNPSGLTSVDASVSGCQVLTGFSVPLDTFGVFNNGNTQSASIIATGTPEPGSLLLAGTGLLGLGAALRWKN